MKPTASLSKNSARLRLTTKSINGGYYKGNRTGSVGAHTNYGGYIIDWRKVRTYNCPKLEGFELTPFVTRQMEPTRPINVAQPSPPSLKRPIDFVSEAAYNDYVSWETRTRIDGLEMIRSFKADLPIKYSELVEDPADPAEDGDEGNAKNNETAPRPESVQAKEAPRYEESKP